jgi:hypothetical protein
MSAGAAALWVVLSAVLHNLPLHRPPLAERPQELASALRLALWCAPAELVVLAATAVAGDTLVQGAILDRRRILRASAVAYIYGGGGLLLGGTLMLLAQRGSYAWPFVPIGIAVAAAWGCLGLFVGVAVPRWAVRSCRRCPPPANAVTAIWLVLSAVFGVGWLLPVALLYVFPQVGLGEQGPAPDIAFVGAFAALGCVIGAHQELPATCGAPVE